MDMLDTIAKAHAEAHARGVLSIWTVFDHPADFPHSFVARRFEIGGENREPVPHATTDIIQGELQIIRKSFRRCGLICFKRNEEDEPQIIESWL